MFHLLPFYSATGSTTANTAVSSLTGEYFPVTGSQYLGPDNLKLFGAVCMSNTLDRARLNSPTLQSVALPAIRPVIVASTVPNIPAVSFYGSNPLQISKDEPFGMDHTLASGTSAVWGFALVGNQLDQITPSNVFTLRGTTSMTCSANAWTNVGTITWDQSIKSGSYSVISAHVISTNGIMFRLIHPSQVYRPGGLCVSSAGNRVNDYLNYPYLGTWLNFTSQILPGAEVFAAAADTNVTVFIHYVRNG